MHFQVCSAVRAEEVRRAGGKKKKEEGGPRCCWVEREERRGGLGWKRRKGERGKRVWVFFFKTL
jgi:hypothetical protein